MNLFSVAFVQSITEHIDRLPSYNSQIQKFETESCLFLHHCGHIMSHEYVKLDKHNPQQRERLYF